MNLLSKIMNDQIKNLLHTASQYHMLNQFQKAHDCYQQIIQLDSRSHHAHHLLGLLYLQNGFIEQSAVHFNKCLEINPNYKEAIINQSIFKRSNDLKIQVEIEHVDKHQIYQDFPDSTVGGWRYQRMIDFVDCFSNLPASWLTLGDALGHDAYMLKLRGVNDVMASNLDCSNLEVAFNAGKVDKYLAINAESIPFENDSFDYLLCKEALHHMPRPMMAIYEMLRVAKKGVFFIEPQDPIIDWPIKRNDNFYREITPTDAIGEKVIIRNSITHDEVTSSYMDWWEDQAFNYVYTFSKREIRKIALGMGLPSYAIKNFNDFYNPDWNNQEAKLGNLGFDKTIEQIQLHNKVCEITGKSFSYITGLLFKETPSSHTINKLNLLGYHFNITPTRYLPIAWPNFDE